MYLPQDVNILLSVINTKLRDSYGSLDELCGAEGADRSEIEARLSAAGYCYDEAANAFKQYNP